MKNIAILLGCGALTLTGCASTEEGKPQVTDHASQSVYAIEYYAARNFQSATQHLNYSFEQYCSNSSSDLTPLQNSWRETINEWMPLQGQERGPVDALAQNWNIQFWPDKKNTTGRKMTALVKSNTSVTAQDISQQSVAVQGIGSLEWLLFDTQSPLFTGDKESGCRVGLAIAGNLYNNSSIISNAWGTNPWVELDDQAWLSEYISLLSNQLAFTTSKLFRPLAKIGSPRPYFSESWRSKYSLHTMEQNILAMNALYHAEGNGLDSLLREAGYVDLADRMEHQFSSLIESWPETDDLFDSLQTRNGYREALSIFNKLKQLDYLLNQEVAVALGVVIGFNATDGD